MPSFTQTATDCAVDNIKPNWSISMCNYKSDDSILGIQAQTQKENNEQLKESWFFIKFSHINHVPVVIDH